MEINKDYVSLKLLEILCEKGLISKETLQAAMDKFQDNIDKTKVA